MRTKLFAFIVLLGTPFSVAQTISPTPIVVQAANAGPTATVTSTVSQSATTASMQDTLKVLQDMKAANLETLNKQRAALEKLDEVEKAAQQLKIYSKRT